MRTTGFSAVSERSGHSTHHPSIRLIRGPTHPLLPFIPTEILEMRTRPYVKDCRSYHHTLTYNHTNILETPMTEVYTAVGSSLDGRTTRWRFFGLFPNRSRGRRRRTAGNFKGILPFLSISRKRGGGNLSGPWRRDRFWPRAISVRPTANHTPIHEARGGICPGIFLVMGVTCVMHYTHPGIIVTRSFW